MADRVASDYVGGLRELLPASTGCGCGWRTTATGAFPASSCNTAASPTRSAASSGTSGDLGRIELRAASSAAHIYGKPIVSAEAFTAAARTGRMDPSGR